MRPSSHRVEGLNAPRGISFSRPLFLSAPASATVFRDSASGLSLQLAVPGATVCYGRPESLRGDGSECRGLDLRSVQSLDPALSLLAVVRIEDWAFVVNAGQDPAALLPGSISRPEARGYIQGWVKNGPSLAAQEPDFLVINGIQVFRFVSLSKVGAPPSALITYGMAGKSGIVVVVFMTDRKHLARTRELADGVMASVSLPHAESRSSGPSRSRSFRASALGMW